MSAPTAEASALPVTGSGPFTLAIGLLGAFSVLVGAFLRRFAQQKSDGPVAALPVGGADLMTDLMTDLSGTVQQAPAS